MPDGIVENTRRPPLDSLALTRPSEYRVDDHPQPERLPRRSWIQQALSFRHRTPEKACRLTRLVSEGIAPPNASLV